MLLSAVFRVSRGRPGGAARDVRGSRSRFASGRSRSNTPSAGCIFQNPERGRDRVPDGIPWSAGALVDRAGLKGASIGGARVSPTHGNFIVNDGRADRRRHPRADRALPDARCATRFGVELREEIVYLGDWHSYVHTAD